MDDFVSISEAARIAGVSRGVLYRLIKAGRLQTYASALRRDMRLVKRSDLETLMTPHPIADDAKKAVA